MRDKGYGIIAGKGYTSFGVATAIVRICEAIVRDENAVLPVSTLLTGEFGLSNLYLSLPCVLGVTGIQRVIVPPLEPNERAALLASVETIRSAIAAMDAGQGGQA